MRIQERDWVATAVVAAIAVPYIGYLVRGDMPLIVDARGMAFTGLVLGAVAYFVMAWGDSFDAVGKVETALAASALVLGFVALGFAEAAAAETLLAVFMAAILLVWAVKLADHVGLIRGHAPTPAAR